MSKSKKDAKAASIVLNLIVVLWMSYCVYNMMTRGLSGNMSGSKFVSFRYYTIDSNIFAALSCLWMFVSRIVDKQPSSFATRFKFFGTCTVMVTFITVIGFLGPIFGYNQMFAGDNLYMHLIGPVLCLISFCFLDKGPRVTMKDVFKALIFTLLYGILYFVMVIIVKKWPDFYGFNMGGKWYFSFVGMMVLAFVIAVIVKALHNDKG